MTGDTWDDMRTADTIDTRDIIDRIAELEGQDSEDDGSGLDTDEREELGALTAFVAEYDGCFGDSFRDGVTLIADSYFEDYARDLAEDIGALDRKAGWPMDYIDWERAAAALQQDYTSIEIDGTTYWGQ